MEIFMFINDTKELKKDRQKAAFEYSGKHFWGDKSNAGVNYKRGKNKRSASSDSVKE